MLVVEDDPLVLMVAVEAFREAGHTVVEAGTADEAAALLHAAAGAFDAVFSDIETPGELDGMALARIVSDAWPAIVMVLTSGRVRPAHGDVPACVQFLGKPYDPDHVATLIIPQPGGAVTPTPQRT